MIERVRLADCCEIISGATPRTNVPEYWDGEIHWASPTDLTKLNSAYIERTSTRITEAGLRSCATNLLPVGSVLFSSRASIGHVAITTVPMCTNQGFKSFVPDTKRVHNKYLYHWLRSNKKNLERLANGATFKEISKSTISEVTIPLPPLAEQKRIAAILDKADRLRQLRRQAIQKLDELLQSVFVEMFGDPLTVRNDAVIEFGDIADNIRYGTSTPPQFEDSGYPFIRATNIKSGRVSNRDMKFIGEAEAKRLSKCKLKTGNLIVVRSGVNTGDTLLITAEFEGSYAGYDLVADLKLDYGPFINHLFNSPSGKRMMGKLSRRAAQPHLNAAQLTKIQFNKPDQDRLTKFSLLYQRLEHSREIMESSGRPASQLAASVNSLYFV